MFHLPYLFELSPLYLAQAALTVWMLVDAYRRGVEAYWYWIIIAFQPLGAWVYFFNFKLRDFSRGGGGLGNLFTRRTSLEELRYRVAQAPTVAAHLELGERLVEIEEFEVAEPHLEAVLAREPEHATAAFALAECHRNTGRFRDAVPLLRGLVAKQPGWRDYLAWHTLIHVHLSAGEKAEAVAQARKLAQITPSLRHKCMLADCLAEAGNADEARRVLEAGLEECRFNRTLSRDDHRWMAKAKQQLSELR
jgi:hypothetical protein